MFGNTLGWIISAFLAAISVFGGYQLLLIAQPTAPTRQLWKQQAYKQLDLTDVATPVLPPMTDPGNDAGDLYRQAISDYDRHPTAYQQMQASREFDESQIAELKGLDLIVQAATASSMHLYSTHPQEVVGYDTDVASLEKLKGIEKAMTNVALLAKTYDVKRYDVASKYARAVAAMGYRLYKERVALIELDAGESFLGDGIDLLVEIAKAEHNDSSVPALAALKDRRLEEVKDTIEPVREVITSQGQQIIGANAGDMIQLAQDPAVDHVWRVEAIRKVGRLQFNAENRADQLKAPKVLGKLADDTNEDPIIRAAAAKARNMTSYDNQSQR